MIQGLIVHAQLPSGTSFQLLPCFMFVSSEGSDLTVWMCKFVEADLACCPYDLYQNLLGWLRYFCLRRQKISFWILTKVSHKNTSLRIFGEVLFFRLMTVIMKNMYMYMYRLEFFNYNYNKFLITKELFKLTCTALI